MSEMSEIALDAICDASARSEYEQFLSTFKNFATCSALQCGVFDTIFEPAFRKLFKHFTYFTVAVAGKKIKYQKLLLTQSAMLQHAVRMSNF